MGNYGAVITIVNRTLYPLILDTTRLTPNHGTWSILPTNIPAQVGNIPSAIVFTVNPDQNNDNGSEGEVHYTIGCGDRPSIKFSYNCNRTPADAKAEITGQLRGFKVTTALTQEECNLANPLVQVIYLEEK